jgi:hypothetical protein
MNLNEIDVSDEDRYWRAYYEQHSYYGRNYDEFQPAFQYGWESAAQPENRGKKFEDVEPQLREHWSAYNGTSRTDWDYMKWAAQDAYNRIQRRFGMQVEYKAPEPQPEWVNVKGNQYNSLKLKTS